MPESRGRKVKRRSGPPRPKPNTPPPKGTPPQSPILPRRRWWQATKWAILFVVGVLGLTASRYQLTGGPPWPAYPEMHPHDTADGSSLILPFIETLTIRPRCSLIIGSTT